MTTETQLISGAPIDVIVQAMLRTGRTEMGFTYMDGDVCRETTFSRHSLLAYLDGTYDTIVTYDGMFIEPDGDRESISDAVVRRLRQQ